MAELATSQPFCGQDDWGTAIAAIYSMAGAQPLQPSFGAMAGDNRQHGRQVAVAPGRAVSRRHARRAAPATPARPVRRGGSVDDISRWEHSLFRYFSD